MDQQLALVAGGQRASLVVYHADLHARHRPPHALGVVGGVGGQVGERTEELRAAVATDDADPGTRAPGLGQVPRTGRRPRHAQAQVGTAGEAWHLEQAMEHRRHRRQHAHPLARDHIGHDDGHEALDQAHGDTEEQRGQQRAVEAEGMREGQCAQHHVVVAQADDRAAPRAVGERQRRVRQDGALGSARAARGVEHQRGGLAAGPVGRGALDHGAVGAGLHHEGGAQVGQDVGALLGLEQGVERGHGDAGRQPAEHGGDELGAIGQADGHAIAFAEAPSTQSVGEVGGGGGEVAVGQRPAVPAQGQVVGAAAGDGLDQAGEVAAHAAISPGSPRSGCAATPPGAPGGAACRRPA